MENKTKHSCKISQDNFERETAIIYCYESEDGYFWVANGEYANTVNYCPECGAKATKTNSTENIITF